MGYYTRNGGLIGEGELSSNKSAIYDLNAIFLNPFVEFTPITFSNCGATGPIGPTLAQCQATYDANVESNLSVNFGYQSYTIQHSGTYRFTVKGASGGVWITSPMSTTTAASSPTIDGYKRLPGATVVGEYALNANDVITMVIGQGGGDDNDADANCPGAGGGTFVTLGTFSNIQAGTDSLLFVAGGGAGSGYNSADSVTLNFTNGRGQSGTSGGSASEAGSSSGGSGAAQTASNSSGGAGYLNGPGGNTTNNFTYTLSSANRVPAGFRHGATGGTWTGSTRGFGGFGGGGQGASTTSSDDDKGGGGGYSGGGYAFDAYETGGGGGSFIHVAATNTSATAGGNTTDRHGSVYLELL